MLEHENDQYDDKSYRAPTDKTGHDKTDNTILSESFRRVWAERAGQLGWRASQVASEASQGARSHFSSFYNSHA